MSNLVRASRELFSRTPDETFDTFDQLCQYCSTLQEHSVDRWEPPETVTPAILDDGQLGLTRISGRIRHGGDRAEIDSRIGRLLALAAFRLQILTQDGVRRESLTTSECLSPVLPNQPDSLRSRTWSENPPCPLSF